MTRDPMAVASYPRFRDTDTTINRHILALIRPLLRANAERTHRAHVVVFFIILVANVGGALTPLGDPARLMGPLAGTLAAISMGAVYMGALTYIGNAPNFMVYAIARERGVQMPSFFAYMFWAALILVPLFVLLTLLPVAPLIR